MRRMNSEFKTANMSEEGQKLSNRDYFGYVEMDDFAINSARLVVESIIRNFTEAPSMGKRHLQAPDFLFHAKIMRILNISCQ